MNKSIFLAIAVVVSLGLWMASGSDTTANESVKTDKSEEQKKLMKVSVLASRISSVQKFVTVQGQVEAKRTVDVKVEVDGRVSQLPVEEGQRIEKGQSMVVLSADYRLKQLSQAKAVLRQRNSDYAASRKLKKRGLLAENRLIADQAAVQTARAQLAIIQHEVDSAKVLSPFAGVLNERNVEMGDYLQKGNSVGVLVDDTELKVSGQVPQQSVAGLQLNEAVEISLSNGTTAFGNLSFISRVANSQTRSYRVEVTLENPELKRLIGLTASLKLPLGTVQGHLLPNSVLGLDSEGDLEVKLLDADNKVKTAKVTIIRTAKSGFWLAGLAKDITVITQGKDFVSENQEVEPIKDTQNLTSDDAQASATLLAKGQ